MLSIPEIEYIARHRQPRLTWGKFKATNTKSDEELREEFKKLRKEEKKRGKSNKGQR